MNHFIFPYLAMGAPPGDAAAQPFWVQLVPIIILFALMYFILLRPQLKKQKEHEALIQKIKGGERVIAAGGIYGTVTSVRANSVILKVAEGVKIEVQKTSILQVNPPEDSKTE